MSDTELKYLKRDYHNALYADHKKFGTDIIVSILHYDAYVDNGYTDMCIVTQEELDYILN